MSGTLPVIWLLLGFNILFLGVFVYRRTRGSKPMGGAMSFFMQSMFVAVNCLSLFQDDLQRYLNWLTGSH